MANFTNIERLYNQLSEDLNEVFTKRTVFSMDNSLSDDEFDYYENVLRISYYLIREYIVNTYGY